jgi:hypothetical protein
MASLRELILYREEALVLGPSGRRDKVENPLNWAKWVDRMRDTFRKDIRQFLEKLRESRDNAMKTVQSAMSLPDRLRDEPQGAKKSVAKEGPKDRVLPQMGGDREQPEYKRVIEPVLTCDGGENSGLVFFFRDRDAKFFSGINGRGEALKFVMPESGGRSKREAFPDRPVSLFNRKGNVVAYYDRASGCIGQISGDGTDQISPETLVTTSTDQFAIFDEGLFFLRNPHDIWHFEKTTLRRVASFPDPIVVFAVSDIHKIVVVVTDDRTVGFYTYFPKPEDSDFELPALTIFASGQLDELVTSVIITEQQGLVVLASHKRIWVYNSYGKSDKLNDYLTKMHVLNGPIRHIRCWSTFVMGRRDFIALADDSDDIYYWEASFPDQRTVLEKTWNERSAIAYVGFISEGSSFFILYANESFRHKSCPVSP